MSWKELSIDRHAPITSFTCIPITQNLCTQAVQVQWYTWQDSQEYINCVWLQGYRTEDKRQLTKGWPVYLAEMSELCTQDKLVLTLSGWFIVTLLLSSVSSSVGYNWQLAHKSGWFGHSNLAGRMAGPKFSCKHKIKII